MSAEIIKIEIAEIMPGREDLLKELGLNANSASDEKILGMANAAREAFLGAAEARGIMLEISPDDFESVYRGEGQNEERTPVADIFPQASGLALFAVTMGEKVSDMINQLFVKRDFSMGYLLDAAASLGADRAAAKIESRYSAALAAAGKLPESACVMRYSPGYCGWHISGQKKLFAFLRPEQIGINLRESFLMEPLKSISGVFLAAERQAHRFEPNYPCCSECADQSCRERLSSL